MVFGILDALFWFCAITGVSALWRGAVLSILWNWFMVPYLQLPELATISAMGVSLVIAFLTFQPPRTAAVITEQLSILDQLERQGAAISMAVVQPLFMLALGAVIHYFA